MNHTGTSIRGLAEILGLHLSSYETLDKRLNISGPQLPPL